MARNRSPSNIIGTQSVSSPGGWPLATALSSTSAQLLCLAAITLLAALLRFYKLGAWSFWGDEILSVFGVFDGFNFNDIRHSLALSLIEFTVSKLGVNEWSARLAPALIGILTIPVLYLPMRRIFGKATALFAALLLALSPWHLYWSQNARFYTLLLLFYTLSLLTFHLGVEEDRPAYLILSLLFLALAARESLVALFLVPVLGTYLLLILLLPLQKPASFRRLPLLGLLLLPLLLVAAYFAWPYLRDLPAWFRGFGRVNNSPVWILGGVAYYLRLSTVCFALGGAAYLLRAHSGDARGRAALLLSLSACVPVLALVALSTFHYTANRYAFVTLTSWLILAAVAAVELLRHASADKRWLVGGALLFLLLDPLGEAFLYYGYQNGNRDDWRAAFAFVHEQMSPGDRVVVSHQQLANYYLERRTIPYSHLDLAEVHSSSRTYWFVEDMTVADLYPGMHQWLRSEAQLVGVFDVSLQARTFLMRVYHYRPPGATGG